LSSRRGSNVLNRSAAAAVDSIRSRAIWTSGAITGSKNSALAILAALLASMPVKFIVFAKSTYENRYPHQTVRNSPIRERMSRRRRRPASLGA
jgi:hypothetical protein